MRADVEIVRHYAPDAGACVQALLALLRMPSVPPGTGRRKDEAARLSSVSRQANLRTSEPQRTTRTAKQTTQMKRVRARPTASMTDDHATCQRVAGKHLPSVLYPFAATSARAESEGA